MNRTEADRLWSHVQTLLRQPSPPDDVELRRAARMLTASRNDAVELMLARWLADTRAAEAAPAVVTAPVAAAPRRAGLGVRDVALLGAGVAGGALLAGALGAADAADPADGFGLFDAGLG